MLVLSRRNNESIIIGDNIKVTILDSKEDRVSIGIDAPKSIVIIRGELLEDTIKSNLEAISSNFDALDEL